MLLLDLLMHKILSMVVHRKHLQRSLVALKIVIKEYLHIIHMNQTQLLTMRKYHQ